MAARRRRSSSSSTALSRPAPLRPAAKGRAQGSAGPRSDRRGLRDFGQPHEPGHHQRSPAQRITNLSAIGSAQVNGSSESEVERPIYRRLADGPHRAAMISQRVERSDASAGNAVLEANRKISAGFGSSPSFYAIGELGGSYTAFGNGRRGLDEQRQFYAQRGGLSSGESLELGLYNGDEVDASGVTGISLTAERQRRRTS